MVTPTGNSASLRLPEQRLSTDNVMHLSNRMSQGVIDGISNMSRRPSMHLSVLGSFDLWVLTVNPQSSSSALLSQTEVTVSLSTRLLFMTRVL